MYFNYDLYVRIFPDDSWQFVTSGRVKVKSCMDYERHLNDIRKILNKHSVYQFKVVSCYEKTKKVQLELPF